MKGDPLQDRRAAAADARAAAAPALRHAHGARADARGRARSSRARGRSCGAWTSWRPSRRCCPADADARAAVAARRGVGRRGAAADGPARCCGRRSRSRPRAMPSATRRARSCPPARAAPCARWRPSSIGVERRLNGAERGRRPRRPARAARPPRPHRRLDRRRRPRRRDGSTPPTCRSPRRSRLMLTIGDVRPFFAGRPAEAHAMGLFGSGRGRTPAGRVPGGVAVRVASAGFAARLNCIIEGRVARPPRPRRARVSSCRNAPA